MPTVKARIDLILQFPGKDAPLRHPGVVLRVLDGGVAIVAAMGTGTYRAGLQCEAVTANSREAKALRLSKDTYFYRSGIHVVGSGQYEVREGQCPNNLFMSLLKLLDPGAD